MRPSSPRFKRVKIYTLTVDLGHRFDEPFAAAADLLVGSTTVMATGTNAEPARFVGTTATAVRRSSYS